MSKHRTRRTSWDRLLSGLLCLALVLGLLPGLGLVQTAGAVHWADPYGQKLVEWGVMKPSSDLRLGATTTRAEIVAMLNRAFGYKKLGSMPFTDVPSSAWYAEDINIAYNAGYFKGTSSKKASPLATLTREEAVVMLARIMRLQETVGESLGFTDSRELSEWSRGLIGAAVDEGIINGLPNGSFSPRNNITRGEVAAMLVRALGTPISKAGSYDELGGGVVYGSVTISSSGVTLRNTIIDGDLYITGGVDLGNVLLENVTVLGRIVISGGGESHEGRSSIILRNVEADELAVDSMVNQFVTVSAYGLTNIPNTYVRSDSYLEDSCAAGYGLHHIELVGKKGTKLQLAGSIKEVVNKTRLSLLQLVRGTAEEITIDEVATGSELLVDYNTVVKKLNLDVATRVYGEGDIIDLVIGADGCEVEILPEHVEIRPGITATLGEGENKKDIGSTEASELSSEPRLLSGYPSVSNNLTPISAEGLYAGNKPGTIYWAVSAIADGSVTIENLINNPTYGGNILKDGEVYQSGKIASEARRDYSRMITGLEPDGSYYISAVLVDERGNRSPLKVISFSTPDDTVPAFIEAPYMSKVSCEVAQVTAMANKNCRLYWVLLEAGATPPTAQNFRSGSFGGNYGSGTMSVVKNVPVSIQVNAGRLQEKTGYDLYLWLNDLDGTKSSEVIKVVNADTNKETDPSFITPDETAPLVTSINQTNYNLPDAIEFSFTINEAPSTLYWAVVTATDTTFIRTTDDPNSLRTQLKMQNGTGSIVNGKKAAAGAETLTAVGAADFANKLSYSKYKTHNFRLYYMAMDADGNCSEVRSIIIHTLDSDPPTVTVTFPEDMMLGSKPQADSDIILIFSEQVKGDGGEDAKTFVDLYNEVKRWEDMKVKDESGTLLYTAKNALRDELAKHITLINVQGRTENNLAAPQRTNGQLAATQADYGWVDWREATVVLLDDGKVALTLPHGTAVQLGGGMEYYFYFENIFDDSFTSNPLMLTRADGTVDGGVNASGVKDLDCYTDTFTTVYALVWLDPADKDIPSITGTNTGLDGTRLDIVIDVTPQTDVSPNSDDRWDMIIWSNTVAYFNLFRRVSEDGGNTWSTWVAVNDPSDNSGLGIRARVNSPISVDAEKSTAYLNGADPYEKILDGLVKGNIYEYGICFTSINNDHWTGDNTKEEPEAWSSLVTMQFSLVAGNRTNIETVSRATDINFNSYLNEGKITEIGSARTETSTSTRLSVSKQFTDKRPPSFRDNSPTFTPSSSTITMNVYLNRTGYLYYLAIPAENLAPDYIVTSGTSTTTYYVGKDNDGSTLNNGEIPASGVYSAADVNNYFTNTAKNTDGRTYIPVSGNDRQTNQAHIYFMTGNPDTTATDKRGIYHAPTSDDIYGGDAYASNKYAAMGSYTYSSVQDTEIIIAEDEHNLKPDTWYYVYLVLRSDSGTFDDVVQVYRVKTAKTQPPAIRINRVAVPKSDPTSGIDGGSATTGVSITVQNRRANTLYDNPMLYYAIARKDDLLKNSLFSAYYKWNTGLTTAKDNSYGPFEVDSSKTDGTLKGTTYKSTDSDVMTVLDAMATKSGSTNLSLFDQYAPEDLKNQVMNYITTATSYNTVGSTIHGYDAVNENSKLQECLKDMQTGGEYVVLACARHSDDVDSIGENYGFAAAPGLYKPDGTPPELVGGSRLVEATITAAYTQYDAQDRNWGKQTSLIGYTFSGTIEITFDKEIYTYDENYNLLQIVGGTNAGDGQITMASLLGASATATSGIKSVTATNGNRTFKIEFVKIGSGFTISLNDIYNSTAVKSDKQLTMRFSPYTTLGDLGTAYGETAKIWAPSFNITWAKQN